MSHNNSLKKLPLLLLFILLATVCYFHLWTYLNVNVLASYHEKLAIYVKNNLLVSISLFCLIYVFVVICLIPGGVILTILAGFLFGNWLGSFIVLVSASLGAVALVFIVRLGLGDFVHKKMGQKLQFMEQAFQRNAFFYILSLRLLPIIPFFLINLAVGVFNIRIRDFFWATFLGISPATLIYANIGTNLAELLKSNNLSLHSLISVNILIGLFFLALLSLLPIFIKKIKRNRLDNI